MVDHASILSALSSVAESGVANRRAAPLLDVGNSRFLAFVRQEYLLEQVMQGGAIVRVVEGSYGEGKTHLLTLLEAIGTELRLPTVRTILSDVGGLRQPDELTRFVLENLELEVDGRRVRSLPNIVLKLAEQGQLNVEALRSHRLPHPGFGRALGHLTKPEHLTRGARQCVARFLCGERVPAHELREHNVRGLTGPLSARNAESALRTFMLGLRLLGIQGALLLFDEADQMAGTGGATLRERKSANLLRRMIDGAAEGALPGAFVVFAALPDFVARHGRSYEALSQRLSAPVEDDARGWRSPVLRLDDVSEVASPEEFVEGVSTRLTELTTAIGRQVNRELFRKAGFDVLQRHADTSYRRHVLKKMCRVAVDAM